MKATAPRLLWPAARPTIECFQPYNRAKRPELQLLGVLGHLTNEDKHRVITPVGQIVGVKLGPGEKVLTVRLSQAKEYLFAVTDPTGHNVKPETTFRICVEVPFLWPDSFEVSGFRSVHDFIRDEVIPAFTGFFQ